MKLRIKELRLAQNLTQIELAKQIQSTSKNIWAYENGAATPPLDILDRIANFFNVSIDYLIGRTDDLGAALIPGDIFQTTPTEQQLITNFRKLPAQSQEYVYGIIQNLAFHS